MKKVFLFLGITFLFFNVKAVETDSTIADESTPDTATVLAFFESNAIILDSCTNMQLYFEIYNWIGTPYRYAGKSKKGIDCSGFSNKIYENVFGKSLAGGSRDLYRISEKVDFESATEGDLVFFKIKKGQISHVGVYLKDGKFAHATTRAGVIISDLSETYYNRFFYKIGRISEVSTGN